MAHLSGNRIAAAAAALPVLLAACAEEPRVASPVIDNLRESLVPVLVVGAPRERILQAGGQVREGAAYVFGRPLAQRQLVEGEQPRWLFPMQRLRGAGPGANGSGDNFGWSSAFADFDGDGADELVVASPGATHPSGQRPGLMNLFHRVEGRFEHRQVLRKGFGRELGVPGYLGDSLSVADITGDGQPDLVAGSPGHPAEGVIRGAVFQYLSRPPPQTAGGGPLLQGVVGLLGAGTLDPTESKSALGTAMAAGDFDGDGRPDLAVIAPTFSGESGERSGGLLEFGRLDDGFRLVALRMHTGFDLASGDDRRGHAVAAADFNRDGFDDVAIGVQTFGAGSEGIDPPGALFLMAGGPGGLSALSQVAADGLPGRGAADAFGVSLAAGDFDGDGHADLAVGAIRSTSPLFGVSDAEIADSVRGVPDLEPTLRLQVVTGRVYVFRNTPEGLRPWRTLGGGGEREAGQRYGAALHASDLNGDGVDDLVVGAPERRVPGVGPERSGAAFVYAGGAGGFTLVQTLTQAGLDIDEEGDRFGLRLSN